jgi:hypothetical protein
MVKVQVWTKFGQNRIKDVASRVFTKMLQKDWQNEGQTDSSITIDWLIDFWCFNATFNNISAILWRSVLVVEEARVPRENFSTDHGQATGELYHMWLRVECTLFCNVQRRAWTHAVLVIGLYELLDPAT